MKNQFGFIDVYDKIFRFSEATCLFRDGYLDVNAEGKNLRLGLSGMPFPEVASVEGLPGKEWIVTEEALSRYADTFLEYGGLEIEGERIDIVGGRFVCKSYNADQSLLVVAFELEVESDLWADGDLSGGVKCRVEQ